MASLATNLEREVLGNQGGLLQSQHKAGTSMYKHRKMILRGSYDFAVSGGAVSAISLLNEDGGLLVVPQKAVVTNVYVDVITTFTSGGSATIALGLNTTTDIKAATAVASYAAGIIAAIPVGTAATAVKLTADRNLVMTVAVAALTAGKAQVLVEYIVSET